MSGAVTVTVAVVSIAVAAVEVGAVVAGAAFTIGTALAVTAAVGATLSAVGMFTGDKTLQTVGTVIGAVGAVGSLANSAGLLGGLGDTVLFGGEAVADAGIAGSANIAEAASSATTGVAEGTTLAETANPFVEAASSAQPVTVESVAAATNSVGPGQFASAEQAANLVPNAAGQGGDAVTTQVVDTGIQELPPTQMPPPGAPPAATSSAPTAADATPVGGQAPGSPPQAPNAPQPTPVQTPVAPQAPTVTGSTGINNATSVAGQSTAAMSAAPGYTAYAPVDIGGGSPFGGILEFLNKHPMLAYGAIQAGSSFFAGAFGGGEKDPTAQQLAAWQAQADANTAAANLQNQRAANIASGIPISNKQMAQTGMINQPVPNSAPSPVQGLINRSAGPQVTGVPA